MIGGIIGAIAGPIIDIIDKAVPDADLARKLKHDIQFQMLTNGHQIEKAAAEIVLAEAKSEHWITANWRPVLMLAITAILVNNFLLAPYLQWAFGTSVHLELPDPLWDLLMIGVGGYVVGRSAEKVADKIRNPTQ